MNTASTGHDAQQTRRTVSIVQAGRALGLGKAGAYRAADAGELKTLKFGERRVVPLAWLEQMLAGELSQ